MRAAIHVFQDYGSVVFLSGKLPHVFRNIHLTPNPQAACPSFHPQMAKCLMTPCSHILLNSLSLLFIPISQSCSLTQLFLLFLALLGSRYLQVDLHTNNTLGSRRLKAAHPAYYHYHTA